MKTDFNEDIARILTMPRDYETGDYVDGKRPGTTSLLDQVFIHRMGKYQDPLGYDPEGNVTVEGLPSFGNWEVEGEFTEIIDGIPVRTINRIEKDVARMVWTFFGENWFASVAQEVALRNDDGSVSFEPLRPDAVKISGNGLAAARWFGVRDMDIFALTGDLPR